MMSGDENTQIKPVLLNGTYAIMKSYTKPYASCRYTHPPVEAVIRMRKDYGLTADNVKGIDVKTYNLAVLGHDHQEIKGAYSAKMSTPYATAVALIYGKAGLQEFGEDALSSDDVKSLTHKVNVEVDEELSSIFPEKQSAIVTIHTTVGDFTERVDFPKGEPENPLDDTEFKERYEALMASGGVDKNVYTSVYDKVENTENLVTTLVGKL